MEMNRSGQTLIETIRQFWTMRDELAQMLDADPREQEMDRGMKKGQGL